MYQKNKELDKIAQETGLTVNGVVNAIINKAIDKTNDIYTEQVFKAIRKLYPKKKDLGEVVFKAMNLERD